MMADGFTKSLGRQQHTHFVNVIGIVNAMDWIEREQRMEDLRDREPESDTKQLIWDPEVHSLELWKS